MTLIDHFTVVARLPGLRMEARLTLPKNGSEADLDLIQTSLLF